MLAASAMEGSRTTLDETVMPPPSTPRGVKRKTMDKEAALPVRTRRVNYLEGTKAQCVTVLTDVIEASCKKQTFSKAFVTFLVARACLHGMNKGSDV